MRHPARRLVAQLFGTLLLLLTGAVASAAAVRVNDVRLWSGPEGTRLVLDLSGPTEPEVFTLENPDRLVVDLPRAVMAMRRPLPDGQGPVKSVRSGPLADRGVRLVLDLQSAQKVRSFAVGPEGDAGHRLVVEIPPAGGAANTAAAAATRPAYTPASVGSAAQSNGKAAAAVPVSTLGSAGNEPASAPVKSVASAGNGRELVIAVDAGHGGQDPGAIGRGGTQEKNVTLAIALKLAALIDAEEGMRAVLIRDSDYFVTLGGRTRKARQLGADMFVSIHADSVLNREVTGSSVYVLSLRGASDEAARWLAEQENAADLKGGVSLDDKNDLLASVLLDVTQKESVSDSVEAASNVLAALRTVGDVHRDRVQHAGFVVLKSPDIPSMLVETAFISNPSEERRLRDPDEQQRIATAIRNGVKNYWYENPPPGSQLAAIVSRRSGGGGEGTRTLAER